MKKREPEQPSDPDAERAESTAQRPADAPPAPGDELAALRTERDQLRDQLARALADLHNIRRRHAREIDEIRGRAIEALAAELLPILDNFELALAAHEQHGDAGVRAESHAMVQGLRMVRGMLDAVLERHGLVEIAAHGEPFDPNLHEAVGVEPHGEVEPGRVLRVLQPGYQREGRVVRPSKVIVAQPQGEAGASRAEEAE